MHRAFLVELVVAAAAAVMACGSDDPDPVDATCTQDQSVQCFGANGCQGTQICHADGSSYDGCVCGSSVGGTGTQGSGGATTSRNSGGAVSALGGAAASSSKNTGGATTSSASGGATSSATSTAIASGGQSACGLSNMSGFVYPNYVPARHVPASCTEQTIRQYYVDCIASSNCTAFASGAAEAQCGACLRPTELGAAAYGPLLKIGNSDFFFYRTNVDGCEELIGQSACAPKMQVDTLCQYNACAQSCSLVDWTGIQPLQHCMNSATTTECSLEHAAAACLSDPNAAFACWGSDFEAQFLTIAKVFCL